MTQTIPLRPIPSQRLNVVLDGQNCTIKIYQRGDNLYLDLNADSAQIIRGALCGADMSLVVNPSPDFRGILFFADLTGLGHDPQYDGLGERFVLCFAPEGEI